MPRVPGATLTARRLPPRIAHFLNAWTRTAKALARTGDPVIDRRTFLAGTGAVLLAAPLAAEAQPAGKVYRIGLLDYSAPDPGRQAWWNVFRQRMRELGYVEGQNVTFEARWAQSEDERLSKLAAELVRLRVDL